MLTSPQQQAVEHVNSTFDIASHCPNLSQSGAFWLGACPFCGGRDRFNVKVIGKSQVWLCRKCAPDKYSDAVAFLRKSGQDFMAILSEHGGYKPPTAVPVSRAGWASKPQALTAPTSSDIEAKAQVDTLPPSDDWQGTGWKLVGTAAYNLQLQYQQGTAVGNWLLARGITANMADCYGLGYNPTWQGKLPPGLVIPCWDSENLWYVKVRLTKNEHARIGAKYLSLAGGNQSALFNCLKADTAKNVLVVEGEFDAILAQHYAPAGVAVVTFGSATTSLDNAPQWGNYLMAKTVRVALDSDGAGQTAQAKWLKWPFITAAVPLPFGKDITEYWQQGGDVGEWITQQF